MGSKNKRNKVVGNNQVLDALVNEVSSFFGSKRNDSLPTRPILDMIAQLIEEVKHHHYSSLARGSRSQLLPNKESKHELSPEQDDLSVKKPGEMGGAIAREPENTSTVNRIAPTVTAKKDDRYDMTAIKKAMRLFPELNNLQKSTWFSKFLNNHHAVVLILLKENLVKLPSGNFLMKGCRLAHAGFRGYTKRISPRTQFSHQYSVESLGTGFVVKNKNTQENDIVVTASHLFRDEERKYNENNIYIVTNFEQGIAWKEYYNNDVFEVKSKNVYVAVRDTLIEEYSKEKLDWAVFKIKPFYKKGQQLPLHAVDFPDSPPQVNINDAVYAVGHGLGLPKKTSIDARIIETKSTTTVSNVMPYQFLCEIDMLSGNSGSPIFNAQTHELVGIFNEGKQILMDGVKYLYMNHLDRKKSDAHYCQEILERIITAVKSI